MANALYTNYKNKLLGNGTHALADWDTDDIRATLTDHAVDTPVVATDQDYADISAGEIANTGASIAGVAATISAGGVDIDDFAFATVSGDQSESITFYLYDATPTIAPLLVYIDTATGLPITPNGADINVVIDVAGLFTF